MEGRLTRRLVGVLNARLPEAALEQVCDPRRKASVTWPLQTLLTAVLTSIVAGSKSLAQMENLTAEMSGPARKFLGLSGRLPDTTVRDVLVRLDPDDLRQGLRSQIHAAHRRKALSPVGLPFGVVSLDGKFTALRDTQSKHVSYCTSPNGEAYGKLGTITATLISAAAKPCLDARPIGSGWGESSVYPHALHELMDSYGSLDLFKLVVYDAGACSRVNARETRNEGLHYLFRLKQGSQPKLYTAVQRDLGERTQSQADGVVEALFLGKPERRSVYLGEADSTWPQWTGKRTIVRVLCEKLDPMGKVLESDDRYYISSLDQDTLSGEQWVAVTRGHWAVENNCHHTFDAVLREDEKPWIQNDARGMLAVLLLRRMAYNILTLFRTVTQRSNRNKKTPWRDLCRWFNNALLVLTKANCLGLRTRQVLTNKSV